MGFETIDISGDAGIRAYGSTAEEMFINAAIGMYSLITDVNKIEERQEVEIAIKGDSAEGLLVKYLNELIFHFDTYNFIGRRIEISSFSIQPPFFIKAEIFGEEFDIGRHERRLLIKAATYHNIKIEQVNDRWEVAVIFDI
jgi:SHS2 domain-containing protein